MHLKCPLVIGFHLLAHIVLFFCVSNGLLGASLWVVFPPWYSQGIHLHSQCTTHPLNISMFGNVYSIFFLFSSKVGNRTVHSDIMQKMPGMMNNTTESKAEVH